MSRNGFGKPSIPPQVAADRSRRPEFARPPRSKPLRGSLPIARCRQAGRLSLELPDDHATPPEHLPLRCFTRREFGIRLAPSRCSTPDGAGMQWRIGRIQAACRSRWHGRGFHGLRALATQHGFNALACLILLAGRPDDAGPWPALRPRLRRAAQDAEPASTSRPERRMPSRMSLSTAAVRAGRSRRCRASSICLWRSTP